jgi:glycosyltransferase involved in cell wall biosynthesis
MKKICIVTPEFPPEQWGGLAKTVGNVARHAADMGLQVHVAHFVIVPDPFVFLDENRETATVDGFAYHRIRVGKEDFSGRDRELWDCPHTLTLQMMYQSLEMLHMAHEFHLFHSFFLYPAGYVAGLLANRVRVPSVVTIVGNDVKKYLFSPEKTAICRSGLENADRVAALSRDLVEIADALTPIRDKSAIVYNSVDIPERGWKGNDDEMGTVRIGCAGIFKYAKGLPYLFKAVAALDVGREVTLELRGALRSSEQAVFDHVIRQTGIKHRIRLLDPIPRDRISDWLRSLDIFVLPSVTEGCPNILMEAMACGVPCIATATGAVEDLMENGISGRVVPWGDSRSLADALKELMDHPERARSFGRAARKRMEGFSRGREFLAWKDIYRGLIEF